MLFGTYYLFTTMPRGFIPSQDSGFMFAMTMGPQDISFDNMAKHHRAIAEVVRKHSEVDSVGAFVMGGNQAFVFARMKPREERQHSVDEIIADLRPKVAASTKSDDLHAQPSADPGQRPAYDKRIPAHPAKCEP